MNNLILYLVPPIAGALIGYVTNALAIKMLFRPLRPLHFMKIRIPFTPGILPRQRHKLADNIGRMVERELLTVDILRQRLHSPSFSKTLGNTISEYTEHFSTIKLGELPEDWYTRGAKLIKGLLDSPVFDSFFFAAFDKLMDRADRKSLPDLLSLEKNELRNKLEDQFARIMASTADTAAKGIAAAVDAAYPNIIQFLRLFLDRPELRSELEAQGRVFLRSAILKLNVFQRIFLSAGQYDKTLHDRMPEILDDLYDQVEGLLWEEQSKKRLRSFIEALVARLLSNPGALEVIARFMVGLGEDLLDKPIRNLLESVTGMDRSELRQKSYEALRTSIQNLSEDTIQKGLVSFVQKRKDLSIMEFLSLKDKGKESLDSFVLDRLLILLDERLPGALEALDVRSLVTERIDSLEMEGVERIVLDVLANQLKWINLFGAILGALIGTLQVVLSQYLSGP